jgi:hypothetical protein
MTGSSSLVQYMHFVASTGTKLLQKSHSRLPCARKEYLLYVVV